MPRDERTPRERLAWVLRWVAMACFPLLAVLAFPEGHLLTAFAWVAIGASLLSRAAGLHQRSPLLKRATDEMASGRRRARTPASYSDDHKKRRNPSLQNSLSEGDPANTIVLIHGLWMTHLSREHWLDRYEARGFRVLVTAWPGMDGDINELRRDPSGIGLLRW